MNLNTVTRIKGIAFILKPKRNNPGKDIHELFTRVGVHLRFQGIGITERHKQELFREKIKIDSMVAEDAFNDLRTDHRPMRAEPMDDGVRIVIELVSKESRERHIKAVSDFSEGIDRDRGESPFRLREEPDRKTC